MDGTLLRVRWLLACALALPCALARATPLIGASPGGPVFVGPTSRSGCSIFWTPAAVGLMEVCHVMVLGPAGLDAVSISRARIASSDGEPSSSGDRSFSSQAPLYATPGGLVGIVSDLGSDNF